jgi:hypothetical protein
MKFVVIDPRKISVEQIDAPELHEALNLAGLTPHEIDHGVVTHGIGIVVYEFGLFVPPTEQRYFAVGKGLYAGTAVLYGYDERGETVDLAIWPPPRFFGSIDAIEQAIAADEIVRPRIAIDSTVTWEWPQPMEIPPRWFK